MTDSPSLQRKVTTRSQRPGQTPPKGAAPAAGTLSLPITAPVSRGASSETDRAARGPAGPRLRDRPPGPSRVPGRRRPGRPLSVLGSVHYATVTLPGIGYGDIVPVTTAARLVNTVVITPMRVMFLIVLVGTTLQVLTERTRTN